MALTPQQIQANRDKLMAQRKEQKSSGLSNKDILQQSHGTAGYTRDNRITNSLVDQGKLPESRREIYPQQSYSSPTTSSYSSSSRSYTPSVSWDSYKEAEAARDPIKTKDIYQRERDRLSQGIQEKVEDRYDTSAYKNLMDKYTNTIPDRYKQDMDAARREEEELYAGKQALFAGQREFAGETFESTKNIIDTMTSQAQQLLENRKASNAEAYELDKAEIDATYEKALAEGKDSYEAETEALSEYLAKRGMSGGGREIIKRTDAAEKYSRGQRETAAQQAREQARLSATNRANVRDIDTAADGLLATQKTDMLQAQMAYKSDIQKIESMEFGSYEEKVKAMRDIREKYTSKLSEIDEKVGQIEYERDLNIINSVQQEESQAESQAQYLAGLEVGDLEAERASALYQPGGAFDQYTASSEEVRQYEADQELLAANWERADKMTENTGNLWIVSPETGQVEDTGLPNWDREALMIKESAKSATSGGGGTTGTAGTYNPFQGTSLPEEEKAAVMSSLAGMAQEYIESGRDPDRIGDIRDDISSMFSNYKDAPYITAQAMNMFYNEVNRLVSVEDRKVEIAEMLEEAGVDVSDLDLDLVTEDELLSLIPTEEKEVAGISLFDKVKGVVAPSKTDLGPGAVSIGAPITRSSQDVPYNPYFKKNPLPAMWGGVKKIGTKFSESFWR